MHNKSCFILTRCLIINCQDIQRNALHDLQTTNGEGMKNRHIARINYPMFLYNFKGQFLGYRRLKGLISL